MHYDEETYRIKDWFPPWVDNGERLLQIVRFLNDQGDEDAWKVFSVLLTFQLNSDIISLKYLNDQLREIEKNANFEQD